ncbi:rod shape-determining protein RodA [Candidatus Falkowbacteria bacterium]|nr:rod shape-determining protein RodA [Candidatus Falkowbacteria bacterium]
MLNRLREHFYKFDWFIIASLVLLIAFGLIEIYSVSLGRGGLDLLNFRKQLFFAGLGLALLIFFSFVDYYFLRSLSPYLFWGGVILLIAVLFFGDTARGTKGWFNLFGFSLQPVEFIKAILIIYLANYFANLATKVKNNRHFITSFIITAIFSGLVMLQPDFGSALILIGIWFALIVAADFNLKYFLIIGLSAIILFTSAWFFFFKTYQKERIINFVSPNVNSLDSGYNISQSVIAIGSGGLTGKGVGFGSQSQLKFLPEAQNDFIFAVIAEELGFLGVILVLFFYGLLFWRVLRAVRSASNDFAIYFLIGAMGLIFIQMFINIGMNLGIMPVVGLPLPFISAGGSSLLSLMIIMGIIQNIIIKNKTSY